MRNCLCIVIALISSVSRGQDVAPGRPASEYLAEADRLAGLRAWTRAERFFVHAERAFEEAGDSRNALYAKLGRIRGELPRRSVADVSQQLAEILELPLAMTDDRIRLRCLIIKGEVDMDYDADLAEQDWREALTIAKRLNDPLWVNRANAELGITVALQGRTSDGLFMIASALKKAEATKDLSSVVRWSSVIGKGLFQFGRPEEALKFFDRAIAAGSSVDELRFSLMAYLGKITALTKLKRFEEARELLATTLAVARERESFGYQAELLLQDALLTEAGGTREDAVQRLLEAADFARRAGANRVLAEIYLELGRLQLALGRKKDAAGTFRAGIQSTRAMRERLLSPRLLAQFAEIEMANGQLPAARVLLERGLRRRRIELSVTHGVQAEVCCERTRPQLRPFLHWCVCPNLSMVPGRRLNIGEAPGALP